MRISDVLQCELEIQDLQEFFWTDSTVVLGYINTDARRFHTFVANRVQRIKSSTKPEQWFHVGSEDNPADHASRGLTAESLKSSNWFTGPKFLWQKKLPVEELKVGELKEDDPELCKTIVCNTKAEESRSVLDCLCKFSDWSRAIKAIAILIRRIREFKEGKQKSKLKRTRLEGTNLEERKNAELVIVRLVQEEAFIEKINSLELKNAPRTKTRRFRKLNPFLDENGILRVGGRLCHAALHPHVKHPVILPKNHHVSSILVKHFLN